MTMELLPTGANPGMLRDWADSMDRREGRATIHSDTLRYLAMHIPIAERVEDGLRDELKLNDGMLARQCDVARAAEHEVAELTRLRRLAIEEMMGQKERADRAEHDRDLWRGAAENLQRAMDEGKHRQPTPPDAPAIRPAVAAFALLMERKLRENDSRKGHWKECPVNYLLARIPEECSELLRAVLDQDGQVGDETGDIGNFSMMVADVCGDLPVLPEGMTALRGEEVRR
jgi:hypothetical protein